MVLEDVTGVKIEGANFDSSTTLQLFSPKTEPTMGLIYGKNGTGKSTISRAFSKVKGEEEPSIISADLIDENGNALILTEDDKKRIHIFNEAYIDKHIRLRPDGQGLETIVVLGQIKNIEDEINEAQKAVDEQKPLVETQNSICERYKDEKDEISPLFHENEIKSALRGEANWAGRDAKIKGNQRASAVKDNAYTEFVRIKPSKKRDELVTDFSVKLKELSEARSGVRKIIKPIVSKGYLSFDVPSFLDLLEKKIEKPDLSEREKFLLTVLIEEGQEHPQKIKTYFSKTENKRCPFCLQPVDEEYKKELFTSIERALSKDAEEHQKELYKRKCEKVFFDYSPYSELSKKLIDNSEQCLEALNKSIDDINALLKQKIDDVYTPILGASCDIELTYKAFCTSLEKLENARVDYNAKAVETAPIIDELNRINRGITYYDIIEKYKKYKECLSAEEKEKKKLSTLSVEMANRMKALEDLKNKKRDARIAKNDINKGLRYIFYDKDRLSIEMHDGQYYLKSRGKSVSPGKVSVGERNAIALCYFFTEIMREQEEKDVYRNQYLIVIDDPVSSFDVENRIGIMSFLKYQLNHYIGSNPKTKVLILSHDMQTIYDLEKIYGEITDAAGIASNKRSKHFKTKVLHDNILDDFFGTRRNEYSTLMVNIYKYAKGINHDYEVVVGNSMRRVLEAFSSFMYRKPIEKISTDSEIVDKLPEPFASHFENLMYRLVLHGGSHSEERVMSMVSDDFFDYISADEKKRTAKEVLVFLSLLDNIHVTEHLKKDVDGSILSDVQNDLAQWKTEIEGLLTSEDDKTS